jgi:hypothetical protein
MKSLQIKKTNNSPEVIFNPELNQFSIKGESRPEDVQNFYGDILKWLDDYLSERVNHKNLSAMNFDLFLEYFNSSSAKSILSVIRKVNEYLEKHIPVTINWIYEKDDEDMLETGKEMSRYVKIPFKFTEI